MKYVSSYACAPVTAAAEFALMKREYSYRNGRRNPNEVIAYHIIQSFRPGETDPEEANRIAYGTAMRITRGKHAFIAATHTDRPHIHSHIIICPFTADGLRKYTFPSSPGAYIREVSGRVCAQYGFTGTADIPRTVSGTGIFRKTISGAEILRFVTDRIISEGNISDLPGLIREAAEYGYGSKISGNGIYFKSAAGKRFIPLSSLGPLYSPQAVEKELKGISARRTPCENGPVLAADFLKSANPLSESAQETLSYICENNIRTLEDFETLEKNTATEAESIRSAASERTKAELNILSYLEREHIKQLRHLNTVRKTLGGEKDLKRAEPVDI